MKLQVVAIYPEPIPALLGLDGVRSRRMGKQANATIVPCTLETVGAGTMAKPVHAAPADAPAPLYRGQLTAKRQPMGQRSSIALVLDAHSGKGDTRPDQYVRAPIFDSGFKMIFEFQRAHLLLLDQAGMAELRLVAVHPDTGAVGTQTLWRFPTRYLPLLSRCQDYLAGGADLFPPRPRPAHAGSGVPSGPADLDLEFASGPAADKVQAICE